MPLLEARGAFSGSHMSCMTSTAPRLSAQTCRSAGCSATPRSPSAVVCSTCSSRPCASLNSPAALPTASQTAEVMPLRNLPERSQSAEWTPFGVQNGGRENTASRPVVHRRLAPAAKPARGKAPFDTRALPGPGWTITHTSTSSSEFRPTRHKLATASSCCRTPYALHTSVPALNKPARSEARCSVGAPHTCGGGVSPTNRKTRVIDRISAHTPFALGRCRTCRVPGEQCERQLAETTNVTGCVPVPNNSSVE